MNRPRTLVVVAALVVAVAVVAVVAVRAHQRNSHSFANATVTAVGVSPNRKAIWVQVASYYSPSCTVSHPVVDRHDGKGVVRVRVEHTQDFCTLEMCTMNDDQKHSAAERPGTLDVPDTPSTATPGCQQYGVDLDQPVREKVDVVAG